MRDSWRSLLLLVRLSFQAEPWRTVGNLVLYPLSRMLVPLGGLWIKFVVDGVQSGNSGLAIAGAVALAVTMVGERGLDLLAWRLSLSLEDRAGFALQKRIVELASGIPGIEHYENPAYFDRLQVLREQQRTLASAFYLLGMQLADVGRAAVVLTLLAFVDPRLLMLAVVAVPCVIVGSRSARKIDAMEMETAAQRRLGEHLFKVSTTPQAGKELRVFGLWEEILGRWRTVQSAVHHRRMRAWWSSTWRMWAAWMLFGVTFVVAILLVVLDAVRGGATPGTVILTVTVASQVNSSVTGVADTMVWLQGVLRLTRHLRWLEDYASGAGPSDEAVASPPLVLMQGIRLKDVIFRYPDAEQAALRDVDLELPAGGIIALVGENGAGKTTLVKLLCRLYEPSSGSIEVDGRPLRAFDVSQWRSRTTACFQDFARLELVAGESIGVGDVSRIDDEVAIRTAMHGAGADDVLSGLPSGLGTQLGTRFDGVDLSGGQWQKLALGRSLMPDRPLLLVLDEPTAALDAETEHLLFERYSQTAREASESTGSVTVLVSHRFSTVSMADLIVVLDEGRIVEQGTHDELLAQGGLYAELYELQARAYR